MALSTRNAQSEMEFSSLMERSISEEFISSRLTDLLDSEIFNLTPEATLSISNFVAWIGAQSSQEQLHITTAIAAKRSADTDKENAFTLALARGIKSAKINQSQEYLNFSIETQNVIAVSSNSRGGGALRNILAHHAWKDSGNLVPTLEYLISSSTKTVEKDHSALAFLKNFTKLREGYHLSRVVGAINAQILKRIQDYPVDQPLPSGKKKVVRSKMPIAQDYINLVKEFPALVVPLAKEDLDRAGLFVCKETGLLRDAATHDNHPEDHSNQHDDNRIVEIGNSSSGPGVSDPPTSPEAGPAPPQTPQKLKTPKKSKTPKVSKIPKKSKTPKGPSINKDADDEDTEDEDGDEDDSAASPRGGKRAGGTLIEVSPDKKKKTAVCASCGKDCDTLVKALEYMKHSLTDAGKFPSDTRLEKFIRNWSSLILGPLCPEHKQMVVGLLNLNPSHASINRLNFAVEAIIRGVPKGKPLSFFRSHSEVSKVFADPLSSLLKDKLTLAPPEDETLAIPPISASVFTKFREIHRPETNAFLRHNNNSEPGCKRISWDSVLNNSKIVQLRQRLIDRGWTEALMWRSHSRLPEGYTSIPEMSFGIIQQYIRKSLVFYALNILLREDFQYAFVTLPRPLLAFEVSEYNEDNDMPLSGPDCFHFLGTPDIQNLITTGACENQRPLALCLAPSSSIQYADDHDYSFWERWVDSADEFSLSRRGPASHAAVQYNHSVYHDLGEIELSQGSIIATDPLTPFLVWNPVGFQAFVTPDYAAVAGDLAQSLEVPGETFDLAELYDESWTPCSSFYKGYFKDVFEIPIVLPLDEYPMMDALTCDKRWGTSEVQQQIQKFFDLGIDGNTTNFTKFLVESEVYLLEAASKAMDEMEAKEQEIWKPSFYANNGNEEDSFEEEDTFLGDDQAMEALLRSDENGEEMEDVVNMDDEEED